MRLFFILCCLGIVSVTVSSCSGDDPAPDPELVVSTEALSFSNTGETKFFHIKANLEWEVTSSESWLTLSPSSGNAGTIKIDATVSNNQAATVRTATISVTVGSLSKEITLTQSGSVFLTVSQSEFAVAAEGQGITVQLQSSGTYEMFIDEEWITLASGSGSNSPTFTVAASAALRNRSGTITFSLGDLTQVVTIDQSGNPLNIPADATGMSSDASVLAAQMGLGWNLGNSLEATGVNNGVYTANETMWGNPKTTKALIDAVKAAGFNAVRIPCAWSGYIEDETTYKIKDSWLARVKEVVDYCVDNDMYAIVNIHWDGGWLENNPTYDKQEEVNEKQQALWEQIAVYFRNYDEHLLFAGTNEVHATGDPIAENFEVQMSYNQTFVDAVRSTGGKNAHRNLVIQAYVTNIGLAVDHLVMPTDNFSNRLMAEVHYYDPWDFCGLEADASWATVKYFWGAEYAGNIRTSTWGQEAWVDEAFGSMKTKFVDNGIPVILGEYSAMLRLNLGTAQADHIISRNNFLKYVTKAAKDNGLIPFYWDNGGTGNNSSGLFNRTTATPVHTDAIQAITSALD